MQGRRIGVPAGGLAAAGLALGALFGGPVAADTGGNAQASITLKDAAGVVCVHVDSVTWSLAKTGSVDEDGLVTFEVEATKSDANADDDSGNDVDATLQVNGVLTIKNTGSAAATIGNIVVNCQKPKASGGWVTAAADCADATNGDGATQCYIVASASQEKDNDGTYNIDGKKGLFKETSGVSGSLEFTDADSNTIWAITPQASIPAGEFVTLKWVAKFNGSASVFSSVTKVRAEVIVTFGNSGGRGGSGASAGNIDANGNGEIDSDEANVRSVPSRLTMDVPAAETCHEVACLTDAESDLALTGDVTYDSYDSDVSADDRDPGLSESATRALTLQHTGGTGTVTNTATLTVPEETVTVTVQTGVDEYGYPITTDYDFICCPALSLHASATVLLEEETAPLGDYTTFTQGGWGATPKGNNPGKLLADNFASVYPNGLEVGIAGDDGFSMTFTSSTAIEKFLPSGGTAAALTADLVNPTSTSSNVLSGQVLALRLNVDFSAEGITEAGFGDLVYNDENSSLDGYTVAEILDVLETALGGGSLPDGYDIARLNALATNLNEAFDNGNTSGWAVGHLSE